MFVGLFDGVICRGLIRTGVCTKCKKLFSEQMIQNYPFASLKSEGNVIFENNLNNN